MRSPTWHCVLRASAISSGDGLAEPGGAVLNVPAPFCQRSRTLPSNAPTFVGVKSSAAENQVTGW